MPAYPSQFASQEPMERRVKRMREQLARGGDVAQAALLECFPSGFWLYPDPSGGRYLWAHTRTALAADWESKLDANGHLPPKFWPHVYNAATEDQIVGNSMVAGARYTYFRRRRALRRVA
jgi:hypothetical protein